MGLSLTARALIILGIVVALIAGWWRLTAHFEQKGYDRRAAEDRAAMEEQRERNRDLQRVAEKRYVVQQSVREEFIAVTVKEIRHETQNLAPCVLADGARERLRAAARCAREDRPAACGTGEQVRDAR